MTRDRTSLTHWVRASASAPWQALESQLTLDSRWTPLAISRDGRSLIVLLGGGSRHGGGVPLLARGAALKEMMAGHPSEDIGQADLVEPTRRRRLDERRHRQLRPRRDARHADRRCTGSTRSGPALQRSVDAALPGRVNWISGSFAAGTMLVFSTGDVDPGTWHVLDLAAIR